MKEGWSVKTLGEISVMMADGPFGSNLKKEHYTEDHEVRIIQLSNIGEDGWREENTKYTTFKHLETIKRSEVFPDDIVIAKMMPAGRAIICPSHEKKFVLSSDAVKVQIKKGLHLRFILHSINSPYFREQVYENVSGSGRVRTSLTKLRECHLRIPPFAEQQRIADLLDTSFAKIDAIKANVEKNLHNAKELFQAALREELEPKDGWEKKTISDVCSIYGRIGFRGYTKADLVSNPHDGAISLSPSNIIDNEMNYEKCSYISWLKYEESPEIKIFKNDILLVKTGSSYGKCALVENLPHEATINPQFVVLKDIRINKKFLFYFLCTPYAKSCFDEFVSGTAIPTFSQKNLGQMRITVPSEHEQLDIINRLDAIDKNRKQLQDNYLRTASLCDDLKQSLLNKSFNGEQ